MRNTIVTSLVFFTFKLSAQSYYHNLGNDRVTLNSVDQSVTVDLYPIDKQIKPSLTKKYYWYSGNQINYTQGGFSGKLLNGTYTSFHLNKNLKEQGEFKKGLQDGDWKSWHNNGLLKELIKWRNGDRIGAFKRYSEDGSIQQKGRYKNGELHGRITSYIAVDSIQILHYKEGTVKPSRQKKHHFKLNQKLSGKFKNLTKKLKKKKEKKEGSAVPRKGRKKLKGKNIQEKSISKDREK
ncbi:MAG TPA: hypothetical protein VGB63_16335 [Pedobacter sp.]|jgi:hypothetical protein